MPRPVQPGSFVTLHYRLRGPDGADIVSTFGLSPATLSIGAGELAPAMEERLIGLTEGTRTAFDLPAGAAFGARNPELLQWVRRALIAEHGDPESEPAVGDVIQFEAPGGQGQVAGVVRETGEAAVLVDFNHPLAGQPLTFEVEVVGVLA
ncbi:MAG TPA: FKBP-type peptidyl-prolyl cis-trans isomerase [Caldimonas sp.]|nr:FKBP-type peptidyl-prolyl cis-trans isomerase [Caldimonas sp.]